MPAIPFTKMQGLGNDYIYIDARKHPIADPAAFSRRWSNRRTGIGSDGLILIGGSQCADFSMRIFNADGSEGRMCGNGARCVGKYLHDKGLTDKTVITLETLSGIKTLELDLDKDGAVRTVTVGMGKGIPRRIPLPRGGEGVAVDVGNPHLVLFVPEDPDDGFLTETGGALEKDPLFPDGVNVEFVRVLDEGHLRMRVWERGSGITAACGTGACASVVAAAMEGRIRPQGCLVHMDGGTLTVSWDPVTQLVTMTGPAETVFEGTIEND